MEKCMKEGELMVIAKEMQTLEQRFDKCEKAAERKYGEIKGEISSLRKVYDAIHELSTHVAVVATESKGTRESVADLRKDIKELKHLPKETENIKEAVKEIQGDVDKFKAAPAADLQHYKRAIIVAVLVAIVGAFLAGKFI